MAHPKSTLLTRLAASLEATHQTMLGPHTDQSMNDLVDEAFLCTTRISQAPAASIDDLALKLTVLCRRLREHLDPDDRGGVLTALLAESIRDDVGVVLSQSNDQSTTRTSDP